MERMVDERGRKMMIGFMLDEGGFAPTKGHKEDAGWDLRTPQEFILHDRESIDLKVHVAIPQGYVGFLKSKSGLNVKHHITCEGVIDSGYTGSIVAKLYNHSDIPYRFERGDKVVQLVIIPFNTDDMEMVDTFENSERGSNGFGSTGK